MAEMSSTPNTPWTNSQYVIGRYGTLSAGQ